MRISDWSSDVCSSDLGRWPGGSCQPISSPMGPIDLAATAGSGAQVLFSVQMKRLASTMTTWPTACVLYSRSTHRSKYCAPADGSRKPWWQIIMAPGESCLSATPCTSIRSEEHTYELQS